MHTLDMYMSYFKPSYISKYSIELICFRPSSVVPSQCQPGCQLPGRYPTFPLPTSGSMEPPNALYPGYSFNLAARTFITRHFPVDFIPSHLLERNVPSCHYSLHSSFQRRIESLVFNLASRITRLLFYVIVTPTSPHNNKSP